MASFPRTENKITSGVIIAIVSIIVTILTSFWMLSAKLQSYQDTINRLLNHASTVDQKMSSDELLLEKLNLKLDIIQDRLKLNLGDDPKGK